MGRDSTLEGDTSGRTEPALATQQSDSAPLQSEQSEPLGNPEAGAIAGVEGEGAGTDDVPSSGVESSDIAISRASTRFEVRLRPKNEDGTPNEANLATLKQLDEATKLVARVRNRVARWLYRLDSDWLDAQPEPLPKKLEWAPAPIGLKRDKSQGPIALTTRAYRQVSSSPELSRLSSDIIAWASKDVVSKWTAKRWLILVAQTEGLLHYKQHQPIAIPHKAITLTRHEDGSADITLRVLSTKAENAKPITIHVVPRDERQREELRAIAAGEWKFGQLVLSRDFEKRGRWYLRLTYTKLVPKRAKGGLVVVRRGMRSFLVAAHAESAEWIASGANVSEIVDGGDILAFKRQIDARRRSLGRRNRSGQCGSGATGHGTTRRVGGLIDLSDTEARFSKSRSQQCAAALVKFALKHGASEIVLEDFTAPKDRDAFWLVKRWPWYQLGEACKTACEAAGLQVTRRVVSIDRRACPSCGHQHVEPPINAYKVWACTACGMRRSVDQVDALLMLRSVGRGDAVERAEARRKAALRDVVGASDQVAPKEGEALAMAVPSETDDLANVGDGTQKTSRRKDRGARKSLDK